MNYIDTVFWLSLEILDVFNSRTNKILIINFSNSYKQFQRFKCFPNICLHEENALENLV